MKKVLLLVLLAMGSLAQAQNVADRLFSAIENNNSDAIEQLLGSHIELCFNNTVNMYSKGAAMSALRNFLAENRPKSCKKQHSGASRGRESGYAIGQLITLHGRKYKVFAFVESDGKSRKVQELRFEDTAK